MPANLTNLDIDIKKTSSDIRTITGVSTSITAFIVRARKVPIDKPILIHSFSEFERIYGGIWKESYLGYVVDQYFKNGGRNALIIRVISVPQNSNEDKLKYEYTIGFPPNSIKVIFQSANPGSWAKDLSIKMVTKKRK